MKLKNETCLLCNVHSTYYLLLVEYTHLVWSKQTFSACLSGLYGSSVMYLGYLISDNKIYLLFHLKCDCAAL